MTYNAQKGKEVKGQNLPEDQILVGVITDITDGKVSDFIPDSAKNDWKGDTEQPAINVTVEVRPKENTEPVKIRQMFTYFLDGEETVYTERSNLGKFKKKYNKLPEAGDQVKVATDSNGYGKIKLD